MTRTTTRNQRSGFTLVELLTVIGIIAVLAAILYPVIARAGRAVKKTKCQSNIMQIISAIEMYKLDYGKPPYALLPYDPTAARGIPDSQGPLFGTGKYITDYTVFHCPMASDTNDDVVNFVDQTDWDPDRVYPNGDHVLVYRYSTYDGNYRRMGDDGVEYRGEYQVAYNPRRPWLGDPDHPNAKRNVWRKQWDDTTVVTWCPYHRDYKSVSGQWVPSGGSMDLVGFLSKDVKTVPTAKNLPPGHPELWGFYDSSQN